jgi:hypothetical protein
VHADLRGIEHLDAEDVEVKLEMPMPISWPSFRFSDCSLRSAS